MSAGFIVLSAVALMLLPRRWAALPLLLGTCYMTLIPVIELGPFSFSAIRVLIAAGVLRLLLRGEGLTGPFNACDKLMLAWAAWAITSALFHDDPQATVITRLGLIYNACGAYFVFRALLRDMPDIKQGCVLVALLLIPLSAEMAHEYFTGRNLFSVFEGVNEWSDVRDGRVRANGPFAHPILAGSIGACSLPLMLVAWQSRRFIAVLGILACLVIVFTSSSSGPVLSAAIAFAALAAWRLRRWTRTFLWAAIGSYVLLEIVMTAPAHYLLARIDIIGGSTSWHRAELMNSAFAHLSEWALIGTSYTRHWMAYGVGWSENHVDVTNYYIMMGIYGGVPMLLMFVAILAKGLSLAGCADAQAPTQVSEDHRFVLWCVGAALFAHAATFISVSYFDQSVVLFYFTLAAVGVSPAILEDEAASAEIATPVQPLAGSHVSAASGLG